MCRIECYCCMKHFQSLPNEKSLWKSLRPFRKIVFVSQFFCFQYKTPLVCILQTLQPRHILQALNILLFLDGSNHASPFGYLDISSVNISDRSDIRFFASLVFRFFVISYLFLLNSSKCMHFVIDPKLSSKILVSVSKLYFFLLENSGGQKYKFRLFLRLSLFEDAIIHPSICFVYASGTKRIFFVLFCLI